MEGTGDVGPGAIAQLEEFGPRRRRHVEVVEELIEFTIDSASTLLLVAELPEIGPERVGDPVKDLIGRYRQATLDPAEMRRRDTGRVGELVQRHLAAEPERLDRRTDPLADGWLMRHPEIGLAAVPILGEGLPQDPRVLRRGDWPWGTPSPMHDRRARHRLGADAAPTVLTVLTGPSLLSIGKRRFTHRKVLS